MKAREEERAAIEPAPFQGRCCLVPLPAMGWYGLPWRTGSPRTRREEWMAFRQRKNTAAIPRTAPAFEHIVTEASDSFLWRLDD